MTNWISSLQQTEQRGHDPDFTTIGSAEFFESEELVDGLLDIYVSLMASGWTGPRGPAKIEVHSLHPERNIAELYHHGLWLPCSERIAHLGGIDILNDGLPDFAAIPVLHEGKPSYFASVRRIDRPAGWSVFGRPEAYYHLMIFDLPKKPTDKGGLPKSRRQDADMVQTFNHVSAVIDGVFVPCSLNGHSYAARWSAEAARITSATLGVVTDFRNLWNVQTEESVIGDGTQTPIRLGVTPEQAKSLFYAREAPITDAGRKRPILHWVRCHKRRLAAGIDVDISKHLRGVTEFDMGGFGFKITSPQHRPAR